MSLAVITASYARDFEACRLLCDSMDRYVTGQATHYLAVPQDDMAAFARLAGPRRVVVGERELLKTDLWPVPVRWRGRRYFWAPWMSRPIYGWHLQQLRKIAMTLAQPEARVLHVDSDNCFVRPFDAGRLAEGRVPFYVDRGVVDAGLPHHATWLRNAHRLLGLAGPRLPADDYVGQMIVWEKASVAAMTARIEAVGGRPWLQAVARAVQFSEYMLYGVAVTADAALQARHEVVTTSPCLTYWNGPALTPHTLRDFVAGLQPHQSAIAVQSFVGTRIETIRALALGEEQVS